MAVRFRLSITLWGARFPLDVDPSGELAIPGHDMAAERTAAALAGSDDRRYLWLQLLGDELRQLGGGKERLHSLLEEVASHRWRVSAAGELAGAPPLVAALAALSTSRHLRIEATGSSRLPAPVLDRLAADPDFDVRYQLASRPDLPQSTILLLAAHRDPRTVAKLAINPKLDRLILRRLSRHPHPDVQLASARNKNCSEYDLRHLAESEDVMVRQTASVRLQEIVARRAVELLV